MGVICLMCFNRENDEFDQCDSVPVGLSTLFQSDPIFSESDPIIILSPIHI